MPTAIFSSLRSRVWLLVALVAVPLLVDSFVAHLKHRADAIAHLDQDFQLLIRSVRVEEGYLVARTRELLSVMAAETVDLDAVKCAALARHLLQVQPDYQNVGAVLPDGSLFCSGQPPGKRLQLGDRIWFREAVDRREMSRGNYVLSRLSGRYGIVFGLPVMDKAGMLRAVVFANTGLGWLERIAFAGKLPPGWEAAIIAPDGKIVFRQPPDGSTGGMPEDGLADMAQARQAVGLRELPGQRGGDYLYGAAALDSTGGELRIAVGVPKAAMLAEADRDFHSHLLLLALAGIVSVVIGRQAIHRSFVGWAEHVHENMRRFGAGERALRLPETSGIRELREIDAALNRLFDDIKAANVELIETRQDLGLALECANLATWEWDLPDGTKIGNTRFAEMLGYGPGKCRFYAGSWVQSICPDDRQAVQVALQSHFDGAPLYECEFRMGHRGGHWIWVLERGRVVARDAAGRPLRMAGTAMDITRRKLTELELRQRTEELAALLDAIPAPVWLARDPECREIVGNRATYRLYELPSGANLSPTAPEVWQRQGIRHCRPDGVEYAADELPMQRACAESRPIENFELRLMLAGGRNVWMFGNAAPLFDDEGKVRGAVAAFVDITLIRKMDEALRRNEMVLAQAGNLAQVGAWSIEMHDPKDLRGNFAYWSDELYRLFGYEPGEILPSTDLFMAHVHPDDRQRIGGAAMQALEARRACQCEFRIVRRDGAERIVLNHAEFHFGDSGRPTHFIGALRDVTGQKEAEAELLRHRHELEILVAERTYELAIAKEAADRASRAKSQFLANISHELRTPLNSLMLLAHVLADDAWGNLTPQQAEYARMIELSGNDLMHLIDELHDLAKIEAGRLDVKIKSVPFPDIMQSAHRTHRHMAQQKGLAFKMEIGADVPASIRTDPLRLQQLLRNLLSNAIKFTSEGGVTLRIRRAVSGWRYGNSALANADAVIAFDVVDTGIGMAPERQVQILEAFEQSRNQASRECGGTGLGLSISSRIAALLGGELALASVPGQGSTFTLFLPLSYLGPAKTPTLPAVAAAASAPAAAVELLAAIDPVVAGRTALVVDDDERSRFALAVMLEKHGMRVLSAGHGAEALETLARDYVDIVLMDIMMPVMDGYQTVRNIRSDPKLARLPVLALTADVMPGTRDECLTAGYSDYLSKPVVNSELLARLHEWLRA